MRSLAFARVWNGQALGISFAITDRLQRAIRTAHPLHLVAHEVLWVVFHALSRRGTGMNSIWGL